MRTNTIKFCTCLAVSLAAIVIAQGKDDRETATSRVSIDEIRDYRKMFRVNEKPIDMVEGTKYMCASPMMVYGPHYDPGVVYYINEIARKGTQSFSREKVFPGGSIIVKEKQERKTEDSVQIITVMKKVRAGNSEDSWEYKMYDTRKWEEIDLSKRATTPVTRTCIECHRRYKANDYVSDKGVELLIAKSP